MNRTDFALLMRAHGLASADPLASTETVTRTAGYVHRTLAEDRRSMADHATTHVGGQMARKPLTDSRPDTMRNAWAEDGTSWQASTGHLPRSARSIGTLSPQDAADVRRKGEYVPRTNRVAVPSADFHRNAQGS